jgi:hypothetical protein
MNEQVSQETMTTLREAHDDFKSAVKRIAFARDNLRRVEWQVWLGEYNTLLADLNLIIKDATHLRDCLIHHYEVAVVEGGAE